MAAEVNGNSAPVKEDEEPMDITVTHTENYQTLIDAGLPQKVAESLDNIFQTGLVAYADLDDRAIDALREFNEEGALSVLQQFKESDLSHVQNKSAFLCGVMKTYRQREKQGSKVQESTKGPDESKIKALLERTGYTLDVTTGQRKYGGPPPEEVYSGVQPGVGTEVFVGKIPRDLYEDELVPLFEKAGPIWDLRLMMDPLSGQNRGYAFITFCNKDAAQEAVKLCDNYEIRSGKYLGVCISVANNRLFVGSIPKNKTRESILEDFSKVTEGLMEVILYHQPDDKKKNRGFCFLEYEDHKSAAQARRRLMSGKVKVWGNPVTVEWADPVEEPDPEVMAKVKVLFVRNLATPVTEELLEKTFSQFGKLERVKKLKDYAFVHFEDRDAAVKAMQEMNGKELEGEEIEIVLAKPPDKKRKERQAQRQTTRNTGYDDYYYYPPPRMPPPVRGRGRGGRGGYAYPPDYYGYEEYYDDYYGYDYHDYRGGYEDPYYGYDDGYSVRGRGSRVSRGAPPPPRGRGAPPPRGRGGYTQRGAPMGAPRGSRGGRGGLSQQQRGRGARGARGNRGGNVGGKRKADGYNQPDSKRRQTNNQQNWGSQPIAQQPLQQGGDYSGEDATWLPLTDRRNTSISAVFFPKKRGSVFEAAPTQSCHGVDLLGGALRGGIREDFWVLRIKARTGSQTGHFHWLMKGTVDVAGICSLSGLRPSCPGHSFRQQIQDGISRKFVV
ncbi:heterogeneous nuclear ribonucleoprotein R-like isoform X2 [Megalops cyprinoides]|uniref:heterogeneous nuclear ribonucleoprotein R-like isoform X2 n=1 Tax=Megalops cyprinoides TaxID=118141 RepID=UPI0018647B6B|nr:heterogeneous nuclear ribonucleoprotein R-like isoform X2 [Megalops cyprinoides]